MTDRLTTQEVIEKTINFTDHLGFDVANSGGLKTKEDCLEAFQSHKDWLENALGDAISEIDEFIRELDIEYKGGEQNDR